MMLGICTIRNLITSRCCDYCIKRKSIYGDIIWQEMAWICYLPHYVTHLAPEELLLSCRYHHQFQIYRQRIHLVWLFHRCYRFATDFSAMIFYLTLLDAFVTPIGQSQALNRVTHQLLPIWTSTRRISLDFLQIEKKMENELV